MLGLESAMVIGLRGMKLAAGGRKPDLDGRYILKPHPGEMSRITGASFSRDGRYVAYGFVSPIEQGDAWLKIQPLGFAVDFQGDGHFPGPPYIWIRSGRFGDRTNSINDTGGRRAQPDAFEKSAS